MAPTDYQPTRTRSLQPDVLVAWRRDVGDTAITAPCCWPRRSCRRPPGRSTCSSSAVCASRAAYWVVDPLVPSVHAWVLVEGHDLDAGYAEGGQALHVGRPFPITVTPQDLLDR